MASVTSGARPPASFAYSTNGSSRHDSSGPDRDRNFSDPVRGLCPVFDGDPFRAADAFVLADGHPWKAVARLAAARGTQFDHAGPVLGRTAKLDLLPRAYR